MISLASTDPSTQSPHCILRERTRRKPLELDEAIDFTQPFYVFLFETKRISQELAKKMTIKNEPAALYARHTRE